MALLLSSLQKYSFQWLAISFSPVLPNWPEYCYIDQDFYDYDNDEFGKGIHCSCRSKLVSQLTNGQLNSRCDDTRAYVDLYRFIMKTGQSASHNRLWQ